MFSLGGRFENCTACPAGSACPDPAGAPVACTGGNKFCVVNIINIKYCIAHNSLLTFSLRIVFYELLPRLLQH